MHICMYTVYVARYIVVGTVHAACMVSTVTSTSISQLSFIYMYTHNLWVVPRVYSCTLMYTVYAHIHCPCPCM